MRGFRGFLRRTIRRLTDDDSPSPIGWERAGVGGFRVLAFATLGILFFDSPLAAQTPPAKHSSGRYLLIVDTSKAMRPRATAVQTTVNNLLLSGMHAQLQRGDTIGVWTYNEQLYAGRLPLQRWTPQEEQLVASNILAFLKAQPYEKTSHLDKVWPALQSVVKESERLTVLLISDGDEIVSGTPFNRELNKFFKKNSWSQRQKRMPFVTVLRSQRGKFIGITMNLAPWPVEFPLFQPEPKIAVATKPKSPPKNVAPRPTAPPLIVVGEEPASTQPAATPVAPASPTAAQAEEASQKPPGAAVQPKPDVSPVAATPAEPVVATPETKPTLPPMTSPPVITPLTETSHVSVPTSVNPEPTPVTPPAHADELKPEPSSPPATAQVATATQPETIFNRTKILLTVGVFLVLGAAFFFLKQRRARATSHASLITRSMGKDKK